MLIKAVGGRRWTRHEGRREAEQAAEALSSLARAEARAAFGNDAVYVEKYLAHSAAHRDPGAGRRQGNGVHLGERDCSLQRRHQKVLEEAPSPALNAEQRERIGELAAAAIRKLRIPRRRDPRVPVPGRRVLLHRDEHPPAGRAPDHRDGDRHRSGARADPHRRRCAARPCAEGCRRSTATPSSAASTPSIPRPSCPSPGRIADYHPPGGLGVRVNSGALYRLPSCRLTTTAMVAKLIVNGTHAQRMPDATTPLARGVRHRRHRDNHSPAPAHNRRSRLSSTATTTSTGLRSWCGIQAMT